MIGNLSRSKIVQIGYFVDKPLEGMRLQLVSHPNIYSYRLVYCTLFREL